MLSLAWLVEGKKQHVTFIDPHGMRMTQDGFNNPKVNFHQEVKILEQQIGDPDVSLSSFVISITPFGQLGLWDKKLTQADFENHHVLFQDDKDKYIDKIMKAVLKR